MIPGESVSAPAPQPTLDALLATLRREIRAVDDLSGIPARTAETRQIRADAEQDAKNLRWLERSLASLLEDSERLDWWFSHGMEDSVCEGSVDLWWATEINGDATTVVTHGTSLRDAMDRAMRGEYEL